MRENGRGMTFLEDATNGAFRFRAEGWTGSDAKVKREGKSTKAFFEANMNYLCGFGTASKKPSLNNY